MSTDSNSPEQYEQVPCIYIIENLINGKNYIGRAKNFRTRVASHKSELNLNHHKNIHLQSAWNKYGAENFTFKILEQCPVEQHLEREMYWIEFMDTYERGYNRTVGGDGTLGIKDDIRKKMSNRMKGNKYSVGRILSEETKKKISESNKGKKHNPETIKKIAEKHRGQKRSGETRLKISEANRRRKLSQETKDKIADAHRGKKHSEEHKQLLSDINLRRWENASQSQREAHGISSKRNWENPEYRAHLSAIIKRNGRARRKLTIEQANEIRKIYAQGEIGQQTLARQYNVSKSLIKKIVRGEIYLD
jgi:group I intron endonuclease